MRDKILVSLLFIVSAILISLSSIFPWWVMNVAEMTTGRSSWIHIYAWGLVHNASELRQFVMRYETPPLLMQVARVYLALLAVLAIISSIMIFKTPRNAWKPAIIAGVTYLLYTVGFLPLLQAGTSTAPRPIPLQGEKWEFVESYSVRITTYFDVGYYLSLASAILLLVLGLITWRKFTKSDAT